MRHARQLQKRCHLSAKASSSLRMSGNFASVRRGLSQIWSRVSWSPFDSTDFLAGAVCHARRA